MPPRRVPIRQMSPRRRRELRQRAVVRRIVLERDGRCVARELLPAIECAGPSDVHEVKRRAHDGSGWLNASRCVALCRAHHRWVTDHPREGHAVGLVVWSWERQG